jgi:hypothetical protein
MARVIIPETSPEEAIALACVFSKSKVDAAKKAIPNRDPKIKLERRVSFTARVEGVLVKLPDEEKPCVARIPWQTVFAVAMSKLNEVTREKIFKEALEAAIEADEDAKESLDEQIKDEAETLVAGMKAATRKTFSGKTSFVGTVIALNDEETPEGIFIETDTRPMRVAEVKR